MRAVIASFWLLAMAVAVLAQSGLEPAVTADDLDLANCTELSAQ